MIRHIEYTHGYKNAKNEITQFFIDMSRNKLVKINRKTIESISKILREVVEDDINDLNKIMNDGKLWQTLKGDFYIKE